MSVLLCLLPQRAAVADVTVSATPVGRTVVLTQYGPVEGTREGRVQVFRGIRYARPPVGELRFRPPVAPRHWTDVRSARQFAPACPQHVDLHGMPMSEDCLAVNVWTPNTDAAKLPVMVFIHGGADIEGTSRFKYYDGMSLAAKGNLVVVTIQYRLGAWGFMELSEIGGKDYAESGNLGILDKMAAVQWVRDNVGHFGGDPDNITLFGQSTGANSVAWLMGLPQAHRLFQRAIVQSGPLNCCGKSVAQATAVTRAYMKFAGARSVADLQNLSMEQMILAQKKLTDVEFDDTAFTPVIDGVVVKEGLLDAIDHGKAAGIPVIVGTTTEETRSGSTVKELSLEDKPEALLRKQLVPFVGKRADEVIAIYKKNTENYGDAVVQITSDVTFRIGSIQFAELASRRGQRVYMYLFTYRSPDPKIGGSHSIDLPFVFGTIHDPASMKFIGNAPGREALMDNVQQAWIHFATTGDPNHPGLPHWDLYDEKTRLTMELGANSKLVSDPLSEQRRVWGDLARKVDVDEILSVNR